MNKDYTLPIIVTILAFAVVGLCGQLIAYSIIKIIEWIKMKNQKENKGLVYE